MVITRPMVACSILSAQRAGGWTRPALSARDGLRHGFQVMGTLMQGWPLMVTRHVRVEPGLAPHAMAGCPLRVTWPSHGLDLQWIQSRFRADAVQRADGRDAAGRIDYEALRHLLDRHMDINAGPDIAMDDIPHLRKAAVWPQLARR